MAFVFAHPALAKSRSAMLSCSHPLSLLMSYPAPRLFSAGQCLSYENMRDILAFCKEEQLVLIADEVYQVSGAGRRMNPII
jgi:hypothetical protein